MQPGLREFKVRLEQLVQPGRQAPMEQQVLREPPVRKEFKD